MRAITGAQAEWPGESCTWALMKPPVLTNNPIRPNFGVLLTMVICTHTGHDAESNTGEIRPILQLTGFLVRTALVTRAIVGPGT
jgi:hypothetical protein